MFILMFLTKRIPNRHVGMHGGGGGGCNLSGNDLEIQIVLFLY